MLMQTVRSRCNVFGRELCHLPALVTLRSNNPEPRMSQVGHNRTSPHVRVMSALPPKADIALHVRYVPNCDID